MKDVFLNTGRIAKDAAKTYFAPLVIFSKRIYDFWVETWKQSKVLFFAEMIGTLCGMIAASMMAWQSPAPDLFVVFTFYNISAIGLIYASYVRHSSWMLLLMMFYLIVTTIGWFKVFPCM